MTKRIIPQADSQIYSIQPHHDITEHTIPELTPPCKAWLSVTHTHAHAKVLIHMS